MLGIFDSGVGGLSVWKEMKKLSPSSGLLYFADSARAPYGDLSKELLFVYAQEAITHLIELGATSIAIACHTLATTVGPLLQRISSVPVFDIASSSISLLMPYSKIAIIGTTATIASQFYQKALKHQIVSALACPRLVPMIESGVIDLTTIISSLTPLDPHVDAIFLACTHFPLISEAIQSCFPHIPLIDPAPYFASTLLPWVQESSDLFYTTGNPSQFHQCANIFSPIKKVPFPFLIKSLYSP